MMARGVAIWFVLMGVVPAAVSGISLPGLGTDMRVKEMRCEYLSNPLGIDVMRPRLSWKLQSQWRGQRQTAYQVIVASRVDLLDENRGDLWNSGKVFSDQSLDVIYAGAPLTSRMRCYWKVRVWDKNDRPTAFSQIAMWEMGLLDPNDWKAQWLAASPSNETRPAACLRKTFVLSRWVRRARLYVSGAGLDELRLNGTRLDETIGALPLAGREKRESYVVCDVTNQVRRGFNAIAIVLGNNRPNTPAQPGVLCQLEVTFIDGSQRTICSDGTWRSDIFQTAGWDMPDISDADWPIATAGGEPKRTLAALVLPAMQVVEVAGPADPNEPELEVYAFDRAGRFRCSNERLNEIQRDAVDSYRRNILGRGECYGASPEMGLFNFESAPVYTEWMRGFDPEAAAALGDETASLAPILIPWRLYEYEADTRILAEQADRLRRYVDRLGRQADDLASTARYYRAAMILSRMSTLIGDTSGARRYTSLALSIREDFNESYLDITTGLYGDGTPQAQANALYHGLAPPDTKGRVLNNLVAMIEASDYSLDISGSDATSVIEALAANGRSDVVYEIAMHTAQTASEGEALGPWFYRTLAGINLNAETVAFKHFIVRPQLLGDITSVRAEHESRYGTIQSNWDWYAGTFTLKVTVPTNTTATIYVPSDVDAFVNEGPGYIHSGDHVSFVGLKDGYVLFEVESGVFKFVSQVTR